ncbi:MAG: DUF202 domain-containing protein [Nitrospirae bacterium]|nr:DUF202 domain-containing protein [Nitrospirota bacterium]MBF0535387.1 DUF202 domain-containing protein [Nitrospirota bacterium]MBF0616907.1 DUF202 domain-containing protein [Nitrospirota bacterium]
MAECKPDNNEFDHILQHLSNERTFLSWIRTSLSIMAFGFVIEKFGLFLLKSIDIMNITGIKTGAIQEIKNYSTSIGKLLIAVGVVLSLFCFIRYKKIEKQICAERFILSPVLDLILSLCVMAIGILFLLHVGHTF